MVAEERYLASTFSSALSERESSRDSTKALRSAILFGRFLDVATPPAPSSLALRWTPGVREVTSARRTVRERERENAINLD